MSMTPRTRFKWMGAYWSCSNEEWVDLNWRIEQDEPITMDRCRELTTKPKGVIHRLSDAMPRYEGAAR
jgi:hypothetical protein